MDLEVTWIHHWKKNGNNRTLTRPFRVKAVHGLSGLALLNVDPVI